MGRRTIRTVTHHQKETKNNPQKCKRNNEVNRKNTTGAPANLKQGKNTFHTTIKQINLQKKKIACKTYYRELQAHEIMLTQEPYATKNKICFVPTTHKAFSSYCPSKTPPRAAILLPIDLGKKSFIMSNFSNRDLISVKTNIKTKKGVIFTSIYMAMEKNVQQIELSTLTKFKELTIYANNHNIPLIMGSDSNGHHIMWNSYKETERGRIIFNLINSLELNVENTGNSPTFINTRGFSSRIDITLSNKHAKNIISDWKVHEEASLSDHKMISFKADLGNTSTYYRRIFENANWTLFKTKVESKLQEKPFIKKTNPNSLDSNMKYINNILQESLNEICPRVKITHKTKTPWNNELENLKRKTKKRKSKTIHSPTPINREEYASQERDYKRELQRIERQCWRDFCSNEKSHKKLAKFPKPKRKEWESLHTLKQQNGEHTKTTKETLALFANHHFPSLPEQQLDPLEHQENITDEIINEQTYKNAIKTLQPKKAPGPDNIRNEMIKTCQEALKDPLLHIFKQCLNNARSPKSWSINGSIILAKPNKDDYSKPSAFRTISLTSNVQKLLEKMILIYLEEKVKIDKKLTKNQFGFRKKKGTEAALHKLTRRIEDAIANDHYALGIFLDIESAFDKIKFNSIRDAMLKIEIPKTVINWIYHMLSNRTITLELHGYSIQRKITRGCPQGAILSPLLWNITLNTLLCREDLDPNFLQAFADDLAIIIQGTDISLTMRDIAKRYLKTIDKWCEENGVKLSALKTTTIIFSPINKTYRFTPITLRNNTLQIEKEVKYLGITLDKHLRWNSHIKNKTNAAIKLLMACKSYIGKNWGISPPKMRWIYNQVILPTLGYSCFLWIHRAESVNYLLRMLEKVQKIATIHITGGFSTTPQITLDSMAGIMPIEVNLHNIATKTAIRLYSNKCWIPDTNLGCKKSYISHARHLDLELKQLAHYLDNPLNETTQTQNIDRKFSISDKEITDPKICEPKTNAIHVFTDGSVLNLGIRKQAGAGIVIQTSTSTIHEKHYSLGEMTTINQAEMYAINEAAKFLKLHPTQGNNINIFTDSQNSLQKLNKPSTNSKLTLDTIENLNELSKSQNITLHKVRAHIGIVGNELADSLAKKGASTKQIGPEPFLYLPKNTINEILKSKMLKDRYKKITSTKIKPENKELLLAYLKNKPPKLANHLKSNIKNLTGIISGQNHLAHNENKMNKDTSPYCRHCSNTRETTEHFMSNCPAYSLTRLEVFQSTSIPIKQIFENFNPNVICNFINKTERMKQDNITYQP